MQKLQVRILSIATKNNYTYYASIMLDAYYGKNYAGIIGLGLIITTLKHSLMVPKISTSSAFLYGIATFARTGSGKGAPNITA